MVPMKAWCILRGSELWKSRVVRQLTKPKLGSSGIVTLLRMVGVTEFKSQCAILNRESIERS